ncbi:MAG: O-antigen ligase family protein [Ardenticatenaceae bacterium]|nr:O-antigen ligase family protein [Ardenticatenaceae bacterium]
MRKRRFTTVIHIEWLVVAAILPLILFSTTWGTLALGIIPLFWFLRKLGQGNFFVHTPLDVSLLLLSLALLLSTYAAPDLLFSLPKIINLLYGLGLYYALTDVMSRSPRYGQWGAGLFIACGAGIAALSLIGTNWSFKLPGIDRIIALLPEQLLRLPGAADGFHPNEVAGTLLWVLPFCFVLAVVAVIQVRREKKARWLLTAFLLSGLGLLMAGVLFLTQSRGGWLGLIAAFLFLLLVSVRRQRPFLLTTAFLCLALFIGTLLYVGPATVGNWLLGLGNDVMAATGGDELSGRLEIWSHAIYGVQDFAFTGMGLNQFRRLAPELYPFLSISSATDIAHAHNLLLQTAVELGIFGLIAYLAVWLGAAGMLWQTWRQAPTWPQQATAVGFAASLIAYFIYGLTDVVALGSKPGFIFWFLLALIASQYRQAHILTSSSSPSESQHE